MKQRKHKDRKRKGCRHEQEREGGGNQKEPQGTPIAIIRKSNGFNRKSLGTNRKSIAMNGHRKESTGNQKAGGLAPSILSARTSCSQWERVVLCAIYYFPDPVGGGEFTTHTGKQQEIKRLHWDIKGTPKGTIRNTNSNHQEIKWFQQKITRHNRKSIAMNGHRKESTGNQKAGWLAPSILNAHPSYSPRERKKPCAIYFFVAPFPKITTHQKPCAIYPP